MIPRGEVIGMRRALLGLVTAVLAGLSLTAPAAAAAVPPVAVPLTGTVVTLDDPPGPPTGCPAGAVWRYSASGGGTLSHLGRVRFEITHCSYLTGPTTGTFDTGTIVITAANGDRLTLSESGTFVLHTDASGGLISVPTLDWVVTGGTGRFANATGHGQILATSTDLTTAPVFTTGVFSGGRISYAASDRRH